MKHREWSFQSMGEVASFRESAPDNLFAVLQQRIEIVHQRLHFVRVGSFDSASGAIA